MSNRSPVSPLQVWMFGAATLCTMVIAGSTAGSVAYTGQIDTNPIYWLLVFAAAVTWICFFIARTRDKMVQDDENILQRIEDLELRIEDYGDRREVSGHVTALRVTRTQHGRRLASID